MELRTATLAIVATACGTPTTAPVDSACAAAEAPIEAEAYDTLAAPMTIADRADASGGTYLAGSSDGAGAATYRVLVPSAGTYYLWTKVSADVAATSTLAAALDDEPPTAFGFPTGRTWHWTQAEPRELAAGCHTLALHSPTGAAVDQWLLTGDATRQPAIESVLDIDDVWSGVAVGFSFVTRGTMQYIAYYNSARQLTVGQRAIGDAAFQLKTLPHEFAGWDAHNYVTFAFDAAGQIHLAADMHTSALVYFRTTTPGDITTLARAAMVGADESSMTYPAFMTITTGPQAGALLFAYRAGGSGDGNWFWNIYDPATHTWKRWLATALFGGGAGSSSVSAYPVGPTKGPDGAYHLVWVWRATSDASTNFNVSYARSADLKTWQTIDGHPLALPITPAQTAAVVDAVPQQGGLANGQTHVGWDADGRIAITYIKFDAAGNTQAYTARREGTAWKIYQDSQWSWRWALSGTGAIPTRITVGGLAVTGGDVTLAFTNTLDPDPARNTGTWLLDATTLTPTSVFQKGTAIPPALSAIETPRGSLPAAIYTDMRASFLASAASVLRWEALAATNRDAPRLCPTPADPAAVCAMPPAKLQLYQLTK